MAGDKHCGTCRYFGFKGLEKRCRHPEHPGEITEWPCCCEDWLDSDFKPYGAKTFPDPVPLEQRP
jgi:hypothetical protein